MPEPYPRKRVILTAPARKDIRAILRWSEENFGKAAARRYGSLLIQAVRDLTADPQRFGVRQRPELPPDIYLYHLASSRDRLTGEKVKTPRHLLVYRQTPVVIEIVRVLHESRDLARHLQNLKKPRKTGEEPSTPQ